MPVTSRPPLYHFQRPAKTTRKNMLRRTRRFGCGLRSYSILTLRLPVHLPHKSSECRVLLCHWQDHRTPESGSVLASGAPP